MRKAQVTQLQGWPGNCCSACCCCCCWRWHPPQQHIVGLDVHVHCAAGVQVQQGAASMRQHSPQQALWHSPVGSSSSSCGSGGRGRRWVCCLAAAAAAAAAAHAGPGLRQGPQAAPWAQLHLKVQVAPLLPGPVVGDEVGVGASARVGLHLLERILPVPPAAHAQQAALDGKVAARGRQGQQVVGGAAGCCAVHAAANGQHLAHAGEGALPQVAQHLKVAVKANGRDNRAPCAAATVHGEEGWAGGCAPHGGGGCCCCCCCCCCMGWQRRGSQVAGGHVLYALPGLHSTGTQAGGVLLHAASSSAAAAAAAATAAAQHLQADAPPPPIAASAGAGGVAIKGQGLCCAGRHAAPQDAGL